MSRIISLYRPIYLTRYGFYLFPVLPHCRLQITITYSLTAVFYYDFYNFVNVLTSMDWTSWCTNSETLLSSAIDGVITTRYCRWCIPCQPHGLLCGLYTIPKSHVNFSWLTMCFLVGQEDLRTLQNLHFSTLSSHYRTVLHLTRLYDNSSIA